MAKWWTRVNGKVAEHRNQRTALLTLFVWRTSPGVEMALYDRNPARADAVDRLPEYRKKERAKQMAMEFREIERASRKRRSGMAT